MTEITRIPEQTPMGASKVLLVLAGTSALLGLAGCGPSPEQIRLRRAMYSIRQELHPDYRESIAIIEKYRQDPRHKNEYVQYGMCEVSAASLGGAGTTVETVGMESYTAVQKFQDKDREFLAAMGNEAIKFFNGEPHERSMLCFYTGMGHYLRGDYNNARMFFTQSVNAAKTRDEDMVEFREDFQLGWFWLGRAYLKRGEVDDAGAAFGKAAITVPHGSQDRERKRAQAARAKAYKDELRAEAACYGNGIKAKPAVEGIVDFSAEVNRATLPASLPGAAAENPIQAKAADFEKFLSVDFQKRANLFILIEMGQGPIKYLKGRSGAFDEIMPFAYREASADVYVDGHQGGPAFRLLDTYHQAVTRGVQTRRTRQTTKAVAREVLSHVPYAGIAASFWDIKADARYWPALAGEYQVYAAKVAPGLHTLDFKFCDVNDKYLPRYDITRHFINVPAEGETVVFIYALENANNAYLLTHPIASR